MLSSSQRMIGRTISRSCAPRALPCIPMVAAVPLPCITAPVAVHAHRTWSSSSSSTRCRPLVNPAHNVNTNTMMTRSLSNNTSRSSSSSSPFHMNNNGGYDNGNGNDVWGKIKGVLNHFMSGSKQLYTNYKQCRTLAERLKADPNAKYTRAEARLVHRTRIDLRTGIPFILFFGVPIIGNLAPIIALFLPRYLPSTLWTPQQITRFYEEDSQWRRAVQRTLVGKLVEYENSLKNPSADDIAAIAAFKSMLTKSAGGTITNDDIISNDGFMRRRLGIYRDEPQSRQNLEWALAYLNQSFILSRFLPFHQLIRQVKWHFNMITADDRLILAEGGAASLNDSEVRAACHERGLASSPDLSTDDLRAALDNWIALTTSRPSSQYMEAQHQSRSAEDIASSSMSVFPFPFPPSYPSSSLSSATLLYAGALKHDMVFNKASNTNSTTGSNTSSSSNSSCNGNKEKPRVITIETK